MTLALRFGIAFALFAGAACGFDCRVADATEHFNDCDALQARFDALSTETDAESRDDIQTCAELVNCEVRP